MSKSTLIHTTSLMLTWISYLVPIVLFTILFSQIKPSLTQHYSLSLLVYFISNFLGRNISITELFNQFVILLTTPSFISILFTNHDEISFVASIYCLLTINFVLLRRYNISLTNFISLVAIHVLLINYFLINIYQLLIFFVIGLIVLSIVEYLTDSECIYIYSSLLMISSHIFQTDYLIVESRFSSIATMKVFEIVLIGFLATFFFTSFSCNHIIKSTNWIIRSILFLSIFGLIFLGFIFPALITMTLVNPFLYLILLFQQSLVEILFICAYWVFSIALTVFLSSTVMKSYPVSKVIGRKIFHGLAIAMFLPIIYFPKLQPFLCLALGGAFCLFLLLEFLRTELLRDQLTFINEYFELFEGKIHKNNQWIFSHISLLLGCASTIWISSTLFAQTTNNDNLAFCYSFVPFFGLITVGFGDSAAASLGSLYGRVKWYHSNKSAFGTLSAFVTMVVISYIILISLSQDNLSAIQMILLLFVIFMTSICEVFVIGNDNLIMPLYASLIWLLSHRLIYG